MTSRFLQIVSLRLIVGLTLSLAAAPAIALAEKDASESSSELIRVAIYSHSVPDGPTSGPTNLQRFLSSENGFQAVVVSPEDIRGGVLKDFDVLVMPGGSASLQAKKLEESGCENVKNFVREGGGYVGICAGAYLASAQYSWSLGIVNAKVWDRSHWARGTGEVSLCLTPAGCDVLQSKNANLDVYYGQGPLLVPHNSPELPGYEVLATYKTEIAEKGAPAGAMVGTHAIIRTMYEDGRVICFSPHPEKSGGPNSIMMEGIRWAGSGR
ncbi:BPL-N domain-containing protein [Blastopirellula sp. JC732]|uniref:BPL-N domain-containing protein n=1 Tax=Blastopirellula sediminis TaxID=2894196 RepID=A0A9X1MJ33_9BACT|nr:BPL-N domain-containing protein [Blastopirellula sediminis]MCC9607965.1 BPL-N domain-containing protein [Blastopirellula sediminis]MCC9627242.1 BPL-N domain-containing protein [Blastopirellula sediminis]